MLTYADCIAAQGVCGGAAAGASCWAIRPGVRYAYADVCGRMRTYADVCGRILTYADVCGRMLTCGGAAVVDTHLHHAIYASDTEATTPVSLDADAKGGEGGGARSGAWGEVGPQEGRVHGRVVEGFAAAELDSRMGMLNQYLGV